MTDCISIQVEVRTPFVRTKAVILAARLCRRHLMPLSVVNWLLRWMYLEMRVGRGKWERHPLHVQLEPPT